MQQPVRHADNCGRAAPGSGQASPTTPGPRGRLVQLSSVMCCSLSAGRVLQLGRRPCCRSAAAGLAAAAPPLLAAAAEQMMVSTVASKLPSQVSLPFFTMRLPAAANAGGCNCA